MPRWQRGEHPWKGATVNVEVAWHNRKQAMRVMNDEQRNLEIERWITRWEGTPQQQRALELVSQYIVGLTLVLDPTQEIEEEEQPTTETVEDARVKRLAFMASHRPKGSGR